jgi:hypothetical protein
MSVHLTRCGQSYPGEAVQNGKQWTVTFVDNRVTTIKTG